MVIIILNPEPLTWRLSIREEIRLWLLYTFFGLFHLRVALLLCSGSTGVYIHLFFYQRLNSCFSASKNNRYYLLNQVAFVPRERMSWNLPDHKFGKNNLFHYPNLKVVNNLYGHTQWTPMRYLPPSHEIPENWFVKKKEVVTRILLGHPYWIA